MRERGVPGHWNWIWWHSAVFHALDTMLILGVEVLCNQMECQAGQEMRDWSLLRTRALPDMTSSHTPTEISWQWWEGWKWCCSQTHEACFHWCHHKSEEEGSCGYWQDHIQLCRTSVCPPFLGPTVAGCCCSKWIAVPQSSLCMRNHCEMAVGAWWGWIRLRLGTLEVQLLVWLEMGSANQRPTKMKALENEDLKISLSWAPIFKAKITEHTSSRNYPLLQNTMQQHRERQMESKRGANTMELLGMEKTEAAM